MILEEFIKENYGKVKAKEIAKLYNVPLYKVYGLAKKLKIKTNKSRNKSFIINEDMEQILLSGKFGDGNFRRMGNGAIYREKHAMDEKDYCLWKYNMLGDLTSLNKIYYYKDLYINFDTSNSKELLYYINETKENMIDKLSDLGLLLYFLDDGWSLKRKGYYAGAISSVKLTFEQICLIAEKYRKLCNCNIKVSQWHKSSGQEPYVIYIQNITKLIDIANEYKMQNLDIYIKKFKK